MKSFRNGEITLSFIVVGQSCPSHELELGKYKYMSFNIIRKKVISPFMDSSCTLLFHNWLDFCASLAVTLSTLQGIKIINIFR